MNLEPVPLVSLATVRSGGGAPQEATAFGTSGLPFVRAGSLPKLLDGAGEDSLEKIEPDVADQYGLKVFPAGTVLFAKSGMSATKGYVYRLRGPAYVVNHLAALIPRDFEDAAFLERVLQRFSPTALIRDPAYPSIRLGEIESMKVFAPRESTDRWRIAAILDKADALRANRRAALALLDTLIQSIFLDMFGDPVSNPRGWPERTFGELFEISSSKRVLENQWKKEGVPFYRAREIVKIAKQGYVENELFISDELFNSLSEGSGAPKAGDLMVSAVGTLGACYLVRPGDRFYFKDASVLRFSPQETVEPVFVRHAFSTDHVLRQIHSGSGSTVGTYTIARARQTRLYAPPISLQRLFAKVVMCVQSQAALRSSMLNQFDTLFTSLQHRAFRGEL